MFNSLFSILEEKGMFFLSMKNDVAKYVKRTPKKVLDWVRNLRKAGKVTFLATDSYADFADCMLQYAVGYVFNSLLSGEAIMVRINGDFSSRFF